MKQTKVGYQGVPGSYSYIATTYLYPKTKTKGYSAFEEVVETLENGDIDYAVLPIENTLIGSIYEVYDLIYKHNLKIRGEIALRIDHNLLVKKNVKNIKQLKLIYSHQKALDQCRSFFKAHDNLKAIVYDDTARAAKYVSNQKDISKGAIASLYASKLYGLKVLEKKIQSNKENYTRFVIIGKNNHIKSADKTSLLFVAAHKPGSLLACLKPFSDAKLNLTKIESRPLIGSPWKYVFYLDFEHPKNGGITKKTLSQMKPHTKKLRILGTYKKGPTIFEDQI